MMVTAGEIAEWVGCGSIVSITRRSVGVVAL
jgi:hypothetical protein